MSDFICWWQGECRATVMKVSADSHENAALRFVAHQVIGHRLEKTLSFGRISTIGHHVVVAADDGLKTEVFDAAEWVQAVEGFLEDYGDSESALDAMVRLGKAPA